MKNYYEILEVDKKASQEVIEKAYKTLAKKYHPDLQQGEKQQEYAEKMKTINEAYDVLSDGVKREQYNKQLENERIQQMPNEAISIIDMTRVLNQQINAARRQAYHDAYVQDMRNRGYKIKYKHDLKYYLKLIVVFIITAFIAFLIYQIPPVKNFFTELYNENIFFKAFIDVFKNTFSATF